MLKERLSDILITCLIQFQTGLKIRVEEVSCSFEGDRMVKTKESRFLSFQPLVWILLRHLLNYSAIFLFLNKMIILVIHSYKLSSALIPLLPALVLFFLKMSIISLLFHFTFFCFFQWYKSNLIFLVKFTFSIRTLFLILFFAIRVMFLLHLPLFICA